MGGEISGMVRSIRTRPLKKRCAQSGRRGVRLLIAILAPALLCVCQQAALPAQKSGSSPATRQPFLKAQELIREGSLEKARKEILAGLKLHPSSIEGYNLLGIVYSQEKDYARAAEAFLQALKLDPNSTNTRNNLGNAYLAQGKLDLAEKEFRTVLRRDPSNRDGNYNLGLVLMAGGHPADAIGYFRRVQPPDTATLFNLIRAYFRSGQSEEGSKRVADLSAEGKDDVRLHFTLGVLLASEKEYLAAERELEKANALKPGTFEILYNLGQAYLRSGDIAKAELVMQRALKLQPESDDALYLLAKVYAEQKRDVDALELLVRAHKIAPRNADVIFLLARLSMTQKYFEDAIPLLEDGLKIAPERADLHAALGESYFMSGKVDKAIEEFKTLIQLDPSARSYAFMGLCYRHLGRFEEARKYLNEGLKHDPQNASCLFNLGYIESRQGNHAEAEKLFQRVLGSSSDYSEAMLELAGIRISQKRHEEALDLLRRYVKISPDPAPGYYKLAMVERALHQMDAAERDLKVFQTLSKNPSGGPMPYQHLFDYLNNRSTLPAQAQVQLDIAELVEQARNHSDQPRNLYLLAEAYLKLGQLEEARKTITQLDQLSSGDFRTAAGVGVLLARYHLYNDAIQHFQAALQANPDSDDVKYDLAVSYFQTGAYAQALEVAGRIPPRGQQEDNVLALLGDVYAHLDQASKAIEIFAGAIHRNPDNDQYYLSLALTELRAGNLAAAEKTLEGGLARIPDSGKILWGLGIVSALKGGTEQAEQHLERAVELLPEWSASYSALGVFYYQTGQIDKAREVLNRFTLKNPRGGLDVRRIEEALSRAPTAQSPEPAPLSADARRQFLQIALSLADRTL